jgi:hypothetical protein
MAVNWPAGEYLSLLEGAASAAGGEVRLIAPFIKEGVLSRLLAALPEGIPVTVVTRWRADEVAAGVSDLEVLDRVRARQSARLLLCPSLHAKLYLFGTGLAYAGSANLTRAALEEGGNIELLGEIRPIPLALLRFAAMVEARSHPATEAERDRVAAAAAALRHILPAAPPAALQAAPDDMGEPSWLPRFRHPGGLYSLYADPQAGGVPDALLAAAHDLARIAPAEGLTREEFRVAASEALSRSPLWAAVDEFLVTPRFFGALRSWLRDSLDVPEKEAGQALQTLIRWLLWAYPARYHLEQPRHSERFGRTDGDWSLPRRGSRPPRRR